MCLITSKEAATLGADETANSHVDIGGPSLVTVKAFLVCEMLGLNLSHCCAIFVILFPFIKQIINGVININRQTNLSS